MGNYTPEDTSTWGRTPQEKAEITRLCDAVDLFAKAMKDKLAQKADDGWRGQRYTPHARCSSYVVAS